MSRVVVWGQRGGCPACVVGFVSFAWRDEIAMIGPGPGLLSLSLAVQPVVNGDRREVTLKRTERVKVKLDTPARLAG